MGWVVGSGAKKKAGADWDELRCSLRATKRIEQTDREVDGRRCKVGRVVSTLDDGEESNSFGFSVRGLEIEKLAKKRVREDEREPPAYNTAEYRRGPLGGSYLDCRLGNRTVHVVATRTDPILLQHLE